MTATGDENTDGQLPPTSGAAAELYASLGWRVIPIKPMQKHPPVPAWQKAATDDLATIRSWWGDLYRGHDVGVATGSGTGVWVLDVDVADGKQGWETLEQLATEHGGIPNTVTAQTGSGGFHYLFKWDPDRPVTNGHSSNLGPGLDIRGEGGQIVVAPSQHSSGRRYEWVEGHEPWNVEEADAPEWLYEILMASPSPAPSPDVVVDVSTGVLGDGRRPDLDVSTLSFEVGFDDDPLVPWLAAHDWHTELEADGWQLHSTKAIESWWTRPGKDVREGHSAVLHEPDGPLVVFTTEIDPALQRAGVVTSDGGAVSLSKYGYLSGARHGGDRNAIAQKVNTEHRQAIRDFLDEIVPGPPSTPSPNPATNRTPGVEGGPSLIIVPNPEQGKGLVDLAGWWDGEHEITEADTLIRTDGQGLLYKDQLNWIHGDSGSGKTWVLLFAMAQLITAGTTVLWCHYEDPTPSTIVSRLKSLGVERDDVLNNFLYFDPEGEPFSARLILSLIEGRGVEFMALDSIGEALNASGIDEDRDAEVGPWLTAGPRAIVNAGIGFCGVDHLTKSATNKLHPSGSKRKRAAITGAGLLVESINPPTKTSDGRMKIIAAKDRHGNHAQGNTIGIAHLRHNVAPGGADIEFEIAPVTPDEPEPSVTTEGDEQAREHSTETRIGAIVREVLTSPGLTKNQLIPLLPTGSKKKSLAAIDLAIERGLVRAVPGPRNATYLHPVDEHNELGDTLL